MSAARGTDDEPAAGSSPALTAYHPLHAVTSTLLTATALKAVAVMDPVSDDDAEEGDITSEEALRRYQAAHSSANSTQPLPADVYLIDLTTTPSAGELTYTDASEMHYGCTHYRRGARIRNSQCCSRFFTCRLCHDEFYSELEAQQLTAAKSPKAACSDETAINLSVITDSHQPAGSVAATTSDDTPHEINRHTIDEMICSHCLDYALASGQTQIHVQPVGKHCLVCKQQLAAYYCDVCKFFDDVPSHSTYHCIKCGICRRGDASDFLHCDTCGCCYTKAMSQDHKCRKDALQAVCTVCQQVMFSSTLEITFLPCNHAVHKLCMQSHLQQSDDLFARCPVCLKSAITNNKPLIQRITHYLQRNRMPAEYKDTVAYILCNDCEERSQAPWHFMYNQCLQCNSFNTQLLRTEKEEGSWQRLSEERAANSSSAADATTITATTDNATATRPQLSSQIAILLQQYFNDHDLSADARDAVEQLINSEEFASAGMEEAFLAQLTDGSLEIEVEDIQDGEADEDNADVEDDSDLHSSDADSSDDESSDGSQPLLSEGEVEHRADAQ